jgi:hypothetical protein
MQNSCNFEFNKIEKFGFFMQYSNPHFTNYLKLYEERKVIVDPPELDFAINRIFYKSPDKKVMIKEMTKENVHELKKLKYKSVWFDESLHDEILFNEKTIAKYGTHRINFLKKKKKKLVFLAYYDLSLCGAIYAVTERDFRNDFDQISIQIFYCNNEKKHIEAGKRASKISKPVRQFFI